MIDMAVGVDHGDHEFREPVREITIDELLIGHELADNLHTAKGLLLVSRGQIITEQILTRVRNFHASTGLQGRILVADEIHIDA